jgi:hypothetical protein
VNDRKSGTQYAKRKLIQPAKGRKNIDCSRSRFKCISCLYLDSDYSCVWNSDTWTTIARRTKIYIAFQITNSLTGLGEDQSRKRKDAGALGSVSFVCHVSRDKATAMPTKYSCANLTLLMLKSLSTIVVITEHTGQ